MNHDDDLERLIRGSLTMRSNAIGRTTGSVDDVHRRVDLRRGRRRHVAAFGATAMLAIGAFALTAVGSSDPATIPLAPVGIDDSTPDQQAAWRCTGPLDVSDGTDAAFFADCESAAIDGSGAVNSVPVTTVEVYPTGTILCDVPTTPPLSDPITTGVPCDWVPPATIVPADCTTMSRPADVTVPDGYCYAVPTTVFDPSAPSGDDPVYSREGPNCTPGTGAGIECALIDSEQQYSVVAGDSISSIARRYRLSTDTLVAYNEWADGLSHVLFVGDIVLIPPYTPIGGNIASTTTTTIQP